MARFLTLAAELLLEIAEGILPDDIESFAYSCKIPFKSLVIKYFERTQSEQEEARESGIQSIGFV